MKLRYYVDEGKKVLEAIAVVENDEEYFLQPGNVFELRDNYTLYRIEVYRDMLRLERFVGEEPVEMFEISHKEVCGYEFASEEN